MATPVVPLFKVAIEAVSVQQRDKSALKSFTTPWPYGDSTAVYFAMFLVEFSLIWHERYSKIWHTVGPKICQNVGRYRMRLCETG